MKTLSDSLPHRLMLTDHVVLLARPLYPKSWHFKPRLALGGAFSLTPKNCEMFSDDMMTTVQSEVASIMAILPPKTTIQVINQVIPLAAAREWSDIRRNPPQDLRIPVAWQEQSIATGAKYASPIGLEGRLRESRVIWTIRVPLVLPRRALWPLICSNFGFSAFQMTQLTKDIIDEFDDELASFESLCQTLEAQLRVIGLDPVAHHASDLLQTLDTALGSTFAAPPVYHPGTPLASQVGNEDVIFDRDRVLYQNQVAHVFTLHNLPAQTATSMFSGQRVRQGGMPLAIWEGQDEHVSQVVTTVTIPDERTVETNLAFKELKATIEVSSTDNKRGDLSFSTASVSDDIQLFREQVYNQSAIPAYVTTHIVLWGSSDEDLKIKGTALRNRVRVGLTAQLIRESNLTPTLFKQGLPLGYDFEFPDQRHIQRCRLVTSINAADMLPLYGAFRGTEKRTPAVMFQNRLGEPVYTDHFDYPSGHALVTGTTGGGKSFLINHMVAQLLPTGASVVILDRLASYAGACQAFGGDHISIDFDNPLMINPFMGDGDEQHRVRLSMLLGAMLEDVTPGEDGVLTEALNELFDEHHGDLQPVFSDFAAVLRRPHTDWGATGTDLALRLSLFYGGGQFAGFLDGQSTFELNERLTVFELSALEDAPRLQTALSMSLMHILADYFGDISRRYRRKFLFNDEVWSLLLHPASAKVLVSIARTYRKHRTAAVFISQNPDDFASEAGLIIKSLCSIRYFLQMEEDVIDAMIAGYALSPQEARILKTVKRGQQYSDCYMRLRDRQGGVVRLVADPFTLYMASQEDLSIAPRMSDQMSRNGGNFQAAISRLIEEDHQHV